MVLATRVLEIEELLEKRKKRFPHLYEEDLSQIFSAHLFHVEKSFLIQMPSVHLTRLICLHHYLKKKIQSRALSSTIELKVTPSYVCEQESLSISLVVAPFHNNQVLGEEQIVRALSHLISGIKMLPHSFYSYQLIKEGVFLCHFEIKRVRGKPLNHEEILLLQKRLPNELVKSIQLQVPPLIIPRNDEEILKNILRLSQEFQHPDSTPEVIISFQSQHQTILLFQIIVVKAKEEFTRPQWLDTPFTRLKSYTIFPVPSLEGGLKKEAWTCEVEIDGDPFSGANGAIDLRQVRKYLVKILQEGLGKFRDYHGGLFSLQDGYFEKLKQSLERKYERFIPVMEEIFYGFPLLFQMLCSEAAMKHLLSLFVSLQKKGVQKGGFYIEKGRYDLVEILGIKTSSFYTEKDTLLEEIQSFGEKGRVDGGIGASCIEHRGAHYLFLVNLNTRTHPTSMEDLAASFKKGIRREKKKQRTLRINFQEGDLPSLSPHVGVDQCAKSVGKALFEGLTRLSPEGIPELAAAQEMQISANRKLYTFILRKHHWSNGAEVTAYDFERAWKKAVSKKSSCLRSDLFYIIRGAREGTPRVKAVTSNKLVVELEHPEPNFLNILAHPIFSPISIGMEEPHCFNGPFIVKEWARDRHLLLSPNPYYWDKKQIACDEIVIYFGKDNRESYEMFVRGELDWMGDPFGMGALEMNVGTQEIYRQKVNRAYWIYLNTRCFPLNSASIRKAIGIAIDRKKLIAQLLPGSLPLISPIPGGELKQLAQYDENIELATCLLERGLKELGLSRVTFPELTFHYPDCINREAFAKEFQRQLKTTLGIRCRLIKVNWSNFVDILDKRKHQLAGCFLGSPRSNAFSYLELFRTSSDYSNSSSWENQAYQQRLCQISQTEDPTLQKRLCKKAEKFLLDEMPVIPILQPIYAYLLNRENIERVVIDHNGDVDFKWVRIKQ